MPQRSYIDLIRRYPVYNPYGPISYSTIPPALPDDDYRPRRRRQPAMRGTPTVDGPVVHPIIGGGRKQRVPLPVYKPRRPRKS